MKTRELLRELGYGTTRDEVTRFQRDYNKMVPSALVPSGRIDGATHDAARQAREAKVLFVSIRDDRMW